MTHQRSVETRQSPMMVPRIGMLKNLIKSVVKREPGAKGVEGAGRPPTLPNAAGITYAADGFSTTHDAGFLSDPLFKESYGLGAASGHRICPPHELHIEWRVYVCCWAARHAAMIAGDFVECGVSTGIVSRAVTNYVDFGRLDKRFWLVDTFEGIPLEQTTDRERKLAQSKNARHYFDCHADVVEHFARYDNVTVIKGRVPQALERVAARSVSYLHIDMNIAEPEVAAIRYFWDRLSQGAVVVFDDYASLAHAEQKTALDRFASTVGVSILAMPTGQGLLLKPQSATRC